MIVAVAGYWLFRGGEVEKRELVFRLPANHHDVASFHLVIAEPDPELPSRDPPLRVIKVEGLAFSPTDPAPVEVVREMPLRNGEYAFDYGCEFTDGGHWRTRDWVSVKGHELVFELGK